MGIICRFADIVILGPPDGMCVVRMWPKYTRSELMSISHRSSTS